MAEKTLSATQRPWITVDVDIGGPLVYDVNGPNFTFKFILENIGNSPARNVWPDFKIVLLNGGQIITHFDVREIQIEMIKDRKNIEQAYVGHTIFPKERVTQQMTYTITNFTRNQHGVISPMLVGAVYYYSDFGSKPHQTGLMRGISRGDAPIEESTTGRFQPSICIDEGDIQARDLRIIRPPFMSGGYAD